MAGVEALAVESALEQILSSKTFRQLYVLNNFLKYVVTETLEGRGHEIKEYSIAVKGLGRTPDFNPQADAIIRIHAGRLRRVLHQYYQGEGNNDSIIISLGKGNYIPEFTVNDLAHIESGPINGNEHLPKGPVNRVAVLPFKNLSGKQENDFMVDGFCEQLSSDLSAFPEISVISYFSTAKFRNEKPDIRKAGQDLNASHLITGSILRDKNLLRISIQLVNSDTGTQSWTHTYEHTIKSGFLYQIFDDIIKQLVPRLAGYFGVISRSRALSTQLDPLLEQDTIDAVFWYYHYQMRFTEDIFQIARSRIEKSTRLNPDYALGWAILAQIYIDGGALDYKTIDAPLTEANRCVQIALQFNPESQHAYLSQTWLYIFLRDKPRAMESMEKCLALNPHSSFFLGGASFLYGILGEYEKSIQYFHECIILNSYYPWWVNLGPVFTYFYRGNYMEAYEYARKINIPGVFWHLVFRIAALSHLSDTVEAGNLATQFNEQFPGKGIAACGILKAILQDELVHDRIKAGLEKAGVPVDENK